MALYLFGTSALEVTRYLRSVNGGDVPGVPAYPQRLGGAIHTHRQLNELGPRAESLLSHAHAPIHALVPTRGQVVRTGRIQTHLWSHAIGTGAYVGLGDDLYLPSPAFLVQQLATQLDEVALVRVGMELCGFYSMWALEGARPRVLTYAGNRHSTFELEVATTVSKISRYLAYRKGERGQALATRAAGRMLDHSASPMETAVYLLLCLPQRLGGYGLPAPVLNAEVVVTTSTNTCVRYPDLFWPGSSLDVEYQSDQDHSGEWSRYRDSKRMVELAAEKIVVLPLTWSQLKSSTEFDAFATSVRRNLGVRARKADPDWWARHLDLREKLLPLGPGTGAARA